MITYQIKCRLRDLVQAMASVVYAVVQKHVVAARALPVRAEDEHFTKVQNEPRLYIRSPGVVTVKSKALVTNVGGLVPGSIEADFCKYVLIFAPFLEIYKICPSLQLRNPTFAPLQTQEFRKFNDMFEKSVDQKLSNVIKYHQISPNTMKRDQKITNVFQVVTKCVLRSDKL